MFLKGKSKTSKQIGLFKKKKKQNQYVCKKRTMLYYIK